jgi:putative transcriptional regulator
LLATHKNVSRLVRTLRGRMGLTQEKFAARLGVTYPTVNRWENGRAYPSPLAMQQLKELARQLGDTRLMKQHFADSQ